MHQNRDQVHSQYSTALSFVVNELSVPHPPPEKSLEDASSRVPCPGQDGKLAPMASAIASKAAIAPAKPATGAKWPWALALSPPSCSIFHSRSPARCPFGEPSSPGSLWSLSSTPSSPTPSCPIPPPGYRRVPPTAIYLNTHRVTSSEEAFFSAISCGVLWYLLNCYWIYATMHIYGGIGPIASAGILLLYSLVLGLYFGAFDPGARNRRKVLARHHSGPVIAPFVWVALRTRSPPGSPASRGTSWATRRSITSC